MYALGVPLILAFVAYAVRRLSRACKAHSGPQAQGDFAAHTGNGLHEYTDLQGHGALQEHTAVRENCSRRESFFDLCAVLAVSCLVLALCFFPARSLMASFPAFNALFTNLQFPWRLLGVVSFLCAMLGGAALFGAEPGKAEEDREEGMCCRQAGDAAGPYAAADCKDMETGAGERQPAAEIPAGEAVIGAYAAADSEDMETGAGKRWPAAEIPAGRYVTGPYAMTDCRNMRAGAAAGCDDRVGCNRLCVALGIALAVLAIAMVPRYDTANGDYYAYASYDAEYTEGHYMKLIGIPKAKHTIVYPYEWMPEGAGEAEALGASEVVYLPDDAGIVDTSYVRDGLVSQFEYVIGEDTELTGERWAVLPLFAYGGYEALDETGRKIPLEYEDSTEAVNGSEAGGSAEYDTHPAMARSAGGLLQVPLSNAPGVHSYTVTYQAPASVSAGGWASIIGLVCFAAVSVILNRRKSRQAI